MERSPWTNDLSAALSPRLLDDLGPPVSSTNSSGSFASSAGLQSCRATTYNSSSGVWSGEWRSLLVRSLSAALSLYRLRDVSVERSLRAEVRACFYHLNYCAADHTKPAYEHGPVLCPQVPPPLSPPRPLLTLRRPPRLPSLLSRYTPPPALLPAASQRLSTATLIGGTPVSRTRW